MEQSPQDDINGDLAFAARQVAATEALHAQQVVLIERLRVKGQDATEAEQLLVKLEDTLILMRGLQQHLSQRARKRS